MWEVVGSWLYWAVPVGCIVVTIFIFDYLQGRKKPLRPSIDDNDSDKSVRPFKIEVREEDLQDLQERLAIARYPDQLDELGWSHGTNLHYLQKLVEYWRTSFSWREQEALLNSFPQFKTTIDGKDLHFIHRKSKDTKAIPLVMIHGWPGSFFEFYKVIESLTNPPAGEQAFHVVCPSLPGYGFSSPPTKPGYDVQAMAVDIAKLMRRLGYDKYYAQGGDWGAVISSYLPLVDPKHCIGIHINLIIAPPPKGIMNTIRVMIEVLLLKRLVFSKDELKGMHDSQRYLKDESGYSAIQGTKPQTLGYGLNDSPVGLLAWIIEKFRTWSDCHGDVEKSFSKDELLTNVSIYWFTQSITSSTRLYYETQHSGRWGPVDEKVTAPTGCAIFPREIYRPIRRWAGGYYNIQHWSVMPRGGHFAALEVPDLLTTDIRSYISSVHK